ncbi:MAG TPA: serine/threonine-protein kinase, partial [Planctomycetota bacterium]|nr:serine/threonine-protein kinase [Planctomycetota bacterium]
MDHERFQRVAELFEQGCRMPPERREAWLRQSAGDDESLCAELRQLLAADARRAAEPDDDPLARAARRVTAEALDALAEETLPRRLGRFAIEAVLGAGTSGVVFRARGDGESVDVALKVLHGGAGSARAHQRFRNEAHILARLRHAGIVRVTDSGVVAWAGRQAPYLAMELVEGERLDAWARDHRPPPAARLAVLRDVARAVDHAHGHGVVHRDLKPANVLVRPDGSPCVVDFGIAHALAALDLTTLETASGQLLGTLAYMSPEQVSGERNVGPASDVYALAALLHELLMGAPPLDVRGLTLPAAARRVSEGVPPQLQALRDAHGLALGSVVERALRRDPSERHATAGAFADELQRLLDGGLSVEPVHPRSVGAHAVAARRGPALSRHLPAATALAAAALIAWAWSARPPGTAHTAGVPERVADRAPASGFRVAGAHSVLTPHDGGQRQRLVQAATPGQLSRIAELRRL